MAMEEGTTVEAMAGTAEEISRHVQVTGNPLDSSSGDLKIGHCACVSFCSTTVTRAHGTHDDFWRSQPYSLRVHVSPSGR